MKLLCAACTSLQVNVSWLQKKSGLNNEFKKLIRAARFVCIATEGPDGLDLSPRGGSPGLVHILDDRTLAIPDMLGNDKQATKLAIIIHTQEVYPHCSRATIRSEIWKPEGQLDKADLPSMGQVVKSLLTAS